MRKDLRRLRGKRLRQLPTSGTTCGQQFVHRGSLGLHQPLLPVVVHGLNAMRGLLQETPTIPQADVPRLPDERDPLEGLLYDPVCTAGSVLGRGLDGRVLVPEVPVTRGEETGTIQKQPTEKKKKESVEVAIQTTTTRGRGRKPRVFLEERDIVFRHDRAVQTVLGGLNVSDLPKEAGAPVSRSVWDTTWRPPVTIIRDTAMNRF